MRSQSLPSRQSSRRFLALGALQGSLLIGAACSDSSAPAVSPAVVKDSPRVTAPKPAQAAAEKAATDPSKLTAKPPRENPSPARPEGVPADDPLFGKPLVIGGEVIPFEVVRHAICLGTAGAIEVELAKLQVYIDEEIKRRREAGAKDEDLSVSEAELASMRKETEDELQREYPGGEMTFEDVMAGMDDGGRSRLIMNRLFEKLFLPDDPANLPPISVDAIVKSGGGESVIEELKSSYALRMQSDPPAKKDATMRLFDQIMIQTIIEYQQKMADIVDDPAKLPPGVLMRVNGVEITTDDIWKRIQSNVDSSDVRAAKQWLTNMKLLREALQEALVTVTDPETGEQKTTSAWLSDEEAAKAYQDHSGPYQDTMFTIEKVALAIKRFPSVRAYMDYRRVYDSFTRMVKDDLTEDVLQKQGEFRTSKVIGQVAVDVDVILLSAFDFKAQRWKENGWQDAKNRAIEVTRLISEKKRPWDEIMNEFSEFYDPPLSVSQKNQPNPPKLYDKGRFRNAQRNNFIGEIEESEYSLFLNGGSITDFIFFQQSVGQVAGPMRGPRGYYITLLRRRSEPMQRKNISEADYMTLVEEDYLMWHLNLFAQELIKKKGVYGLD